MPWGTHFCHFYRDRSDLLEIVVPYFRTGVDDNEFCLWLTWEPADAVVARQELRRAFVDADRQLDAGGIEIVPCNEWYLSDGEFDPERVIAGWGERLGRALTRGYAGMRVHANEGWLTRKTWDAFAKYEQTLNDSLAGQRMIVLCTYPLEESSGTEIFDVARTHQFTIARRGGGWEVMETVDLIAAKAEIQRLNRELEERVQTRTRELAAANEALREGEELYRILTENSNDIVTLHEVDGRRVYLSPSYVRLLGEVPATRFGGIHPEDLPAVEGMWDRVVGGEKVLVTFRHAHLDGSWRWLENWGTLVRYQGRPHVLTVARDITERKRLEDEVHQAQKMEAVGRLAGGVAHDFNNLLTAIIGYSQLVLYDLPADSTAAADVGEIRLAAERARGVTRQLLAFSRRQVLQPKVVDVCEVVRGIERMLRLLLREDIHFEVRTCGRPLRVHVDPIQIDQLLMNMVVNARDATGPGGRIVVEAGFPDAAALHGTVPEYVKPADYARIVVSDTGSGMTAETAARVFEPFFTTKPSAIGTGLGLSTVYGIVKQSGGYVWVQSQPGKGATFTVLLPITAAKEERAPEAVVPPRQRLQGISVVVVEDEDVVRHFVVDTLRRSGVDVLDFATPGEAMAVLDDPSRGVDVLITDVILPGMSGPELVERIRPRRPDLPVVYMSGYTAEEAAFTDLLRRTPVLEKPFGAEDLLDRVSAAGA
jgi:PAS domain S-box-containing protein